MSIEQMTIYVPPWVKTEIKKLADSKDVSMNTVVVEALELAIATWEAENNRS